MFDADNVDRMQFIQVFIILRPLKLYLVFMFRDEITNSKLLCFQNTNQREILKHGYATFTHPVIGRCRELHFPMT